LILKTTGFENLRFLELICFRYSWAILLKIIGLAQLKVKPEKKFGKEMALLNNISLFLRVDSSGFREVLGKSFEKISPKHLIWGSVL
jgi:hypothetical protein